MICACANRNCCIQYFCVQRYHVEFTMQSALKQKVTVQPGGIVHIELPELVPGSIADVIIIPETAAEPIVLSPGHAPINFIASRASDPERSSSLQPTCWPNMD